MDDCTSVPVAWCFPRRPFKLSLTLVNMPDAVGETSRANDELVAAAKATLRLRFRPYWHVVAAALRTASGQIVTGIHLEAQVGRIAVCAEAIALGRAVAQFGTSDFTHIVAVQGADPDGAEARVVPPCGMCREMIYDYSPGALVLLERDGRLLRVPIAELLPDRYQSWPGI